MELPDLPKSNCARPVLPGLLYFSSLEELLMGGFASHGRAELPPDQLLPQSRWPAASAAIWANCWVGNNNGDLPKSSSCLASSTHLSASSTVFSTSLVGEGFLAGEGWCTGEEGLLPFFANFALSSLVQSTFLPSLSFFGISFVLAIAVEINKKKL